MLGLGTDRRPMASIIKVTYPKNDQTVLLLHISTPKLLPHQLLQRTYNIFILPSDSSILIIPIEQMDLPYPSQKDAQLSFHLSPFAGKRSLILKDSLKNISQLSPLPQKLKRELQYLIQLDYDYQLRELINKQVVNLNSEVGRQGSEQTLVHLCCKVNAVKCLRYLTRAYFQFFPEQYETWANAGNSQRLTGAMLCALTGSNNCLKWLLLAGGIDIHLIDTNKLSAYQMALNAKNEKAVKMLMEYQNGSKKTKVANAQHLEQIIELSPNKVSICQTLYKCLLDCFTCQLFLQSKAVKNMRKRGPSLLGSGIESLFQQQLKIGYPVTQIASDEIQWKTISEYQQRAQGAVLYDTFSPYDMQDICHPICNLLMLLQSLSQHPWQVRKIIQHDKSKSGYFKATLYPKNCCRCISVDSNLPFIAHSNQPLFIADKRQAWPMLIQKALAKQFGSYYKLNELSTVELMQTLTGWPVLSREITSCRQAVQLLQKLNCLGFMYVLQGKPNQLLYSSKNPSCCFTVLNFYTKGDKRMLLVNCPFVDPAWVEKQRHQILALKILRGHYNCRGQMTIWIQQQRLKDYFSSILVAPIRSGCQRYTVITTASQRIYFRVQIQRTLEEPIVLYLLDCQTGKLINTSNMEGWFSQSEKLKLLKTEMFSEQMLSFDGQAGEYLFQVRVPKGKYQIIGWASCQIKIDPLQQSFGELQWVSCLRQHLEKYWISGDRNRIEHTDDYTLVMAVAEDNCVVGGSGALEVIQGESRGRESVRLVGHGRFEYCILRGKVSNLAFELS